MAFKISEFRAAFPTGIARPNLWEAQLSVIRSTVPATFKFRCERADMPGRTVATLDDVGSGPPLKLPYDINYSDIELTIICGNDFEERIYFENWIDSMVGQADGDSGGLVDFYSTYAKGNTLFLRQFDDSGKSLITYTMYHVYPVSISPMNLTWEETNTYQRFTATLNYRHHKMKYGIDSALAD